MLTVIYRRVIFRYNGSSGGGGGGIRGKGWKERIEAEMGDREDRGRERERVASGLRGYQCVSSLQNECPRFLPRGLYHVATIHAPPAAWLLAEVTGVRDGDREKRRLSLISRSVNNKNIDITRPYIKAAAFGSLCV